MNTRKPECTDISEQTILRFADAVEDAPYALDSAGVIDVQLAASCTQDFDPNLTGIEPGSKRPE